MIIVPSLCHCLLVYCGGTRVEWICSLNNKTVYAAVYFKKILHTVVIAFLQLLKASVSLAIFRYGEYNLLVKFFRCYLSLISNEYTNSWFGREHKYVIFVLDKRGEPVDLSSVPMEEERETVSTLPWHASNSVTKIWSILIALIISCETSSLISTFLSERNGLRWVW